MAPPALVVTSRGVRATRTGSDSRAHDARTRRARGNPQELFFAPITAVRNLMEKERLAASATTISSRRTRRSPRRRSPTVQALGWDWDRVNVNGGAIALGHPIGASGARVLTTLLYALKDRNPGTGLATLCLGGGDAVAPQRRPEGTEMTTTGSRRPRRPPHVAPIGIVGSRRRARARVAGRRTDSGHAGAAHAAAARRRAGRVAARSGRRRGGNGAVSRRRRRGRAGVRADRSAGTRAAARPDRWLPARVSRRGGGRRLAWRWTRAVRHAARSRRSRAFSSCTSADCRSSR